MGELQGIQIVYGFSYTAMSFVAGKFKIAQISYTYGTNGIPVTHGQVVSMIDTFHMARQIEKALLDTVTNIIAVMHWGEEYFQLRMQLKKNFLPGCTNGEPTSSSVG